MSLVDGPELCSNAVGRHLREEKGRRKLLMEDQEAGFKDSAPVRTVTFDSSRNAATSLDCEGQKAAIPEQERFVTERPLIAALPGPRARAFLRNAMSIKEPASRRLGTPGMGRIHEIFEGDAEGSTPEVGITSSASYNSAENGVPEPFRSRPCLSQVCRVPPGVILLYARSRCHPTVKPLKPELALACINGNGRQLCC